MKHFATLASLGLAATLLLPTVVRAETPQQTYQRERAECMAGRAGQTQADCLYEARSVLRDTLAGKTQPDTSPETLAKNRLLRCERQPEADRAECQRLARGEGKSEGSVAEGAVVKEIVTRSEAAPPAPPR